MLKQTFDKSGLKRIYEEAKELFLRGKHDQAQEKFLSIYEADCTFRDVGNIVNDYYDMAKDKWIAKYKAQFRADLSKESGDDGSPGSAPLPASPTPISPRGPSQAKKTSP